MVDILYIYYQPWMFDASMFRYDNNAQVIDIVMRMYV